MCYHKASARRRLDKKNTHAPPNRSRRLSRVAGLEKCTGGCFGAVVVKNGKIVGEGYNNVVSRADPTW